MYSITSFLFVRERIIKEFWYTYRIIIGDKFIISRLVELYIIKIIISNKSYIYKKNLSTIYKEFLNNSLQIKNKILF